MTSLTLSEIATGGIAYYVYKKIFDSSGPSGGIDEKVANRRMTAREKREMRDTETALARKVDEIRRSGGANPDVMMNFKMALLNNGVSLTDAPIGYGEDPIVTQAYLSLAVENLARKVATLPTFRAPENRISTGHDGIAERLNGWRAIQGTKEKPLPQGDNLIS